MGTIGEYNTLPPSRIEKDNEISYFQMPSVVLKDWKNFSSYKDILPLEITNNRIKLEFNYTLVIRDITIPPEAESVFFGVGFNQYKYMDIKCDSSIAPCYTGNVSMIINTSLDGKSFKSDDLPSDANGKYIKYNVTFTNVGNAPASVFFYVSMDFLKSGKWRRLSYIHNYTYAMIFPGKNHTWHQKLHTSELSDWLNDFGEDGSNVKREYRMCISANIMWWGSGMGRRCVRFSIDGASPPLSTPTNYTIRTVYWKLNPSSGKTYNLRFNMTLSRRSSDYIVSGNREHFVFFDKNNESVAMLRSYSGMRVVNNSGVYMTQLRVPSRNSDFMKYVVPTIKSVTDKRVSAELRFYMLNTGSVPIYNVTIYPTHGDFNRTYRYFETVSGYSYTDSTLPENPRNNETVINNIRARFYGYGVNASFFVNTLHVGDVNRTQPIERTSFGWPGWATLNDVTSYVDNSPKPDFVNFTTVIHPPTYKTRVYLSVWNWYLSSVKLWSNRQKHKAVFETEKGSIYPGYYEYEFVT